jgi:hypothetical protein
MDYDFEMESAKMIRHYLRRGYPKGLLLNIEKELEYPHKMNP